MWRATLKGLLAHKLRLLLTALVDRARRRRSSPGTYILTDTMNAAFDGLFQQINQGTASRSGRPAVLGGPPGSSGPARRAGPGDAGRPDPRGRRRQGRRRHDRRLRAAGRHAREGRHDRRRPTLGASWIADPTLNSLTIRQGRAPPRGRTRSRSTPARREKYDFKLGQTRQGPAAGPARAGHDRRHRRVRRGRTTCWAARHRVRPRHGPAGLRRAAARTTPSRSRPTRA